jgi:hypothetical protein
MLHDQSAFDEPTSPTGGVRLALAAIIAATGATRGGLALCERMMEDATKRVADLSPRLARAIVGVEPSLSAARQGGRNALDDICSACAMCERGRQL